MKDKQSRWIECLKTIGWLEPGLAIDMEYLDIR